MLFTSATIRQVLIGCFLIAVLQFAIFSATAQVCGYYYSKTITINGSQISGGPHANFPVLISHTDPALTTAAAKVKNANGYDIVFTDNTGTALDFQLEKYNGTTGEIVAWVKIPSITSGTNVTIQMRYGNSTIATNQSTNNTWSSGYTGVWHFNNTIAEGSGAGLTATDNATTSVTGKVGDGRNFVNPNSWVELTNFPNVTSSFTVSGWVNSGNMTIVGQRIFADDVNNSGGYAFSIGDGATGRLRFYSRNSNPVVLDAPAVTLVNNTWYHVAAVADMTAGMKRIYVNGVEVASGAFTNAWGTDTGNASIGGEAAGGETASRTQGILDEVRFANRVLSAGWLATEYNSQNRPTTTVGVVTAGDFYTVGSTETAYGDPSQFGASIWNVYAYNGNNANDASNSYRGFYQHNTLSFNSTTLWGSASNPGAAAGYSGCTVTDDAHTVRYKRRGFTCGYYRIDISGHDDGAQLFINGVSVWSHNGCCDTHNSVWSGFLGTNTTVEFRWTETAGNSFGIVDFTAIPFPVLTPPVTICAGTSTTLTASGAANYNWTPNHNYMSTPYTNASVTITPPGGTANSTQTYTVQTTDATSGCTVSNSVAVTINPSPSTAVTPTTASWCTTGSVNATATGANTYTWSPATGVTVTSPSGHTATLAPTTTTTYTVTGNNNCATTTATVTVTVNTITGTPTDFGTNTWNVYCYTGNNFETYNGYYVHNTVSFDSRTLWGAALSPSSASGYTGCSIPVDNHSFRYKRRGFPCGQYQINIPNHDDNVILYINGVNVFQQDSWYNNVAHNNVWQGYLGANTEVELSIREFGGDSHGGLTFVYLYGPSNSAAQSVWNGSTNAAWTTSSNWCNAVPSNTVGAYIPANGIGSAPIISASGAQVLDLTIGTSATLSVTGSGTLASYGNWTNNGTFAPAAGTPVVISGSNAITFGGTAATTFANLQMNNSNAASLTLQRDLAVNGALTFTAGNIVTGANAVVFNDDATTTGASNASYVSGPVRKIGNDLFTFPIGKGGYYGPLMITAPAAVTDAFTAEFFYTDPNAAGYTVTSLGTGINHVSRKEYWSLVRTTGSSSISASLGWDSPRSGGVTTLADLRVARWVGPWTNQGNAATSGNTTTGFVRSNALSTFGIFTLASSSGTNPLPIELLKLNAKFVDDHILVAWETASEVNNDFFTVHKSTNGKDWRVIGEVPGSGTTRSAVSYSLKDQDPRPGLQYYQLTQTDYDRKSKTFPVISLNVQQFPERSGLVLYPNPTDGDVSVRVNSSADSFTVQVTDATGKMFIERSLERSNALFSAKDLPSGVYMVSVFDGAKVYRAKFVRK